MTPGNYHQMLLQNAARQFIADLENAKFKEAADFLKNKYLSNGYNIETVQIKTSQTNNDKATTQILHG